MNVLKVVTTALIMLSVKIFMEDTVVNVRLDMKDMERLVHVCYLAQNNTCTNRLVFHSSYVYDYDYSVSREVIIGTSVTIGLVLVGILLLLISIGSVKIGRHIKLFLQLKANLKQRQE